MVWSKILKPIDVKFFFAIIFVAKERFFRRLDPCGYRLAPKIATLGANHNRLAFVGKWAGSSRRFHRNDFSRSSGTRSLVITLTKSRLALETISLSDVPSITKPTYRRSDWNVPSLNLSPFRRFDLR